MMINEQKVPSPCLCRIEETRDGGTGEYNALGNIVLDGGALKRRITLEWRFPDVSDAQSLRDALTGGFETLTDGARGLNLVSCYAESIGVSVGARSCTVRLVLKER